MDDMRYAVLPDDPVSIGVLVVTAFGPLTMAGILGALAHVGAPSWRPVDDVVADAVDRLRQQGLLEPVSSRRGAARFVPAARVKSSLPALLDRLSLSGAAPDIGYKLKVMGLDLLDPVPRAKQLEALVTYWRGVAAGWQEAEDRCPCTQASVRGWMTHNLKLARSEIDWLMSMSGGSALDVGRR